MVSGVAPRIFVMARMMTVVSMDRINAIPVVRYGLLMTTASTMLLPVIPASKMRIPTAAPNAAALESPSVNGDASGFLRTDCMATPATARPAPAAIAVSACGILMFQITLSIRLVPPGPPMMVEITSGIGIETEPTDIDTRNMATVTAIPRNIAVYFLPTYDL